MFYATLLLLAATFLMSYLLLVSFILFALVFCIALAGLV